jgi:hypothetical protein
MTPIRRIARWASLEVSRRGGAVAVAVIVVMR